MTSGNEYTTPAQLKDAERDKIKAAKTAVDKAYPGPGREKALVQTKLDEALLWLNAIAAVMLMCAAGGCATLDNTLADIRGGLSDYNAALGYFCPQTRTSDTCKFARHGSEVAEETYTVAAIAIEAGKESEGPLKRAKMALENAWETLRDMFGSPSEPVVPPTEVPAPVAIPAPTAPPAPPPTSFLAPWQQTMSWEEMTSMSKANQPRSSQLLGD